MRTAGVSDLSLAMVERGSEGFNLSSGMLGNSTIDLDSFQVPIARINLTYGDTGSGYTGASPNFYSCPYSTADECLVDLMQTSLNDLLETNGDSGETEFENDQTYTGIAVELCPDSTVNSTFTTYIKGSAVLGSTTYYTNADDGLSADGPAEEVGIDMDCRGVNTDLITEVTIKPEESVNIVLWVEPTGSVFITDDGFEANSNCTDSGLAFCTGYPAIFGTVDSEDPTVERHVLDIQTEDSDGNTYADILLTTLYDSNDDPFGAVIQQIWTNVSAAKSMNTDQSVFSRVTEQSGDLKFEYQANSTDYVTVIEDLPREDDGTDLTIFEQVEEEVTYNSIRLD